MKKFDTIDIMVHEKLYVAIVVAFLLGMALTYAYMRNTQIYQYRELPLPTSAPTSQLTPMPTSGISPYPTVPITPVKIDLPLSYPTCPPDTTKICDGGVCSCDKVTNFEEE